jgi:putative glutamine amidotransferase
VNSIHRQGIKTLADRLVPTAKSEDGLIDGFVAANQDIIAVQWHPEELIDHPQHRKLFEHFARRVKRGV